jgi:hypothetical protein
VKLRAFVVFMRFLPRRQQIQDSSDPPPFPCGAQQKNVFFGFVLSFTKKTAVPFSFSSEITAALLLPPSFTIDQSKAPIF